jgi:hypothetical protein
MSRPTIEPVTEALLPEFAAFLNQHLRGSRSVADWEAGLKQQWSPGVGNHGFVLRDKGQIVGGIGAFYADRTLNGRSVRTCNITSWCVLDAYRQQSMRLAMPLLNQGGLHFTNFSPTTVVASTLKFFKFKEIDAGVTVFLNLPWPDFGTRLLERAQDIETALQGDSLQAYRDHAGFPWLRQIVVGRDGHWCHVVYKRTVYKGLPAATVLYVSDREMFSTHARRLSTHWLRHGIVTTHVETRFLPRAPWPSARRSGFNPKLFLSDSLSADDIDYLYSESVALDL